MRLSLLALQRGDYKPSNHCQHSAPAQNPHHRSDLRVVVQHAEAGEDGVEIVLDKIRIARGDQRQFHRARISHVGRGVEPVLKEEKQAEDKARGLALGEKIRGQEKWHQPLQQGASPKAERRAEPSEQVVPALMDDEVGAVDEKKSTVRGESVGEERDIKNEPGG